MPPSANNASAEPSSPPSSRLIHVDLDNPPGAPRKSRPPRMVHHDAQDDNTRRQITFDDD
jgi:hypothetical protein